MSTKKITLSQVVSINPRTDSSRFNHGSEIAFLGMADISEAGVISSIQTRNFKEVQKGYTCFQNGDILLAKITPCFENGKAVLVQGLASEIGFGSTEFHVLRPSEEIDRRFLFHLVWNRNFRLNGAQRMTGSAGQKRIPTIFLEEYEINLPNIEEQKRIAAILDKADSLRRKRQQTIQLADDFLRATFLDMFGDPVTNPKGWPMSTLKETCEFYAGNSLPEGQEYIGQTDGILHLKVGDMNASGNEEFIKSAREWSLTAKGGIVAPKGSILIPKRGGAIATNKKRILTRQCALDPNLMAIAPTKLITQDYLAAWFAQFDLATITSGSAVPQLNKGDLAPLLIQLPDQETLSTFSEFLAKLKKLQAKSQLQLLQILKQQACLTSRFFSQHQ